MVMFPDANEVSERRANEAGRKLIEVLTKRVRLCEEMTRRNKGPLTGYALATQSRQTMAQMAEIENELDELISETISDIMNSRRDGE